jgi:hypothetical protein
MAARVFSKRAHKEGILEALRAEEFGCASVDAISEFTLQTCNPRPKW